MFSIGYASEMHLNPNSCVPRMPIAYFAVTQSFWYFAQSMAVPLPCSVQHFKTIRQPKRMWWMNKILWDLSLRWVSDGYPILHKAPGVNDTRTSLIIIYNDTRAFSTMKTVLGQLIQISGPRFNIKMISYQHRKPYCGDKTILRPSYLHNGISYTGKMTSFYWIRALELHATFHCQDLRQWCYMSVTVSQITSKFTVCLKAYPS